MSDDFDENIGMPISVAEANRLADEHERVEKAAREYADEHTRHCAAQRLPGSYIDGFQAGVAWARANPPASEDTESYAELREKNFKILSSLNAELLKANAIGLPKVFHDGGFQHGWDIGGERFYKAGHAAGAASRDAEIAALNAMIQLERSGSVMDAALKAVEKERDALKADLAGLVANLESIASCEVTDSLGEMKCVVQVARNIAREALARVRGKGGSR